LSEIRFTAGILGRHSDHGGDGDEVENYDSDIRQSIFAEILE